MDTIDEGYYNALFSLNVTIVPLGNGPGVDTYIRSIKAVGDVVTSDIVPFISQKVHDSELGKAIDWQNGLVNLCYSVWHPTSQQQLGGNPGMIAVEARRAVRLVLGVVDESVYTMASDEAAAAETLHVKEMWKDVTLAIKDHPVVRHRILVFNSATLRGYRAGLAERSEAADVPSASLDLNVVFCPPDEGADGTSRLDAYIREELHTAVGEVLEHVAGEVGQCLRVYREGPKRLSDSLILTSPHDGSIDDERLVPITDRRMVKRLSGRLNKRIGDLMLLSSAPSAALKYFSMAISQSRSQVDTLFTYLRSPS